MLANYQKYNFGLYAVIYSIRVAQKLGMTYDRDTVFKGFKVRIFRIDKQ